MDFSSHSYTKMTGLTMEKFDTQNELIGPRGLWLC